VEMLGVKRGIGLSVKLVRGSSDEKLWDRHKASPVYGKGKGKSDKFWTALARQLISKGLLREMKTQMQGQKWTYMAISLTKEGSRFLQSSKSLLLPQTGDLRLEKPKPKVAVVAPRFGADSQPEDAARTELYRRLLAVRKKVALEANCNPYQVVGEQSLMQIAATKPSSLASIARVSGFTEVKVQKYGEYFVEEVLSYAGGKKDVKLDDFPTEEEATEDLLALGLTDTVLTSVQMWRRCKNTEEVANKRGMKENTIMTHLATALEKGADISLDELNITPAIIAALVQVIYNKPIGSNVARLGPIKEEYEMLHGKDQFDFGIARLVVTMLKREHGCSEEGLLGWDPEDYGNYLLPSNTKDRLQAFARGQPGLGGSPSIKEKQQPMEPSLPVTKVGNRSRSHEGSSSKEKLQQFVRSEGNVSIPRDISTIGQFGSSSGSVMPHRESSSTSSPYFSKKVHPAPKPNSAPSLPVPDLTKMASPARTAPKPVVTSALKAEKKKLPSWMTNPEEKKELMAKRMKTSTLFK